MTIREFRIFFEEERHRKDIPAEASFKPEDVKFINTIYRNVYNIEIPEIDEEDK